MRRSIPFMAVCAAQLVSACGRQPTMDEEMKRDLEAAGAQTIELAPRGAGTKVVSAIESKQPTR